MKFYPISRSIPILVSALLLSSASSDASGFGIDGPYIFETHLRASVMITGDLNGDGVTDFGAVENNDGLVRLYLSNPESDSDDFTERFEKKEILLEKFINSAQAMDTNGDGLDDLVMTDADKELVIMKQNASGGLEPPEKTQAEGTYIHVMSLDNDEFPDVVLEDGRKLSIFRNSRKGIDFNSEPDVIHTSGDMFGHPRVSDLNEDGLKDIVYDVAGESNRLRVMFQEKDGSFSWEKIIAVSDFYDYEFLPDDEGDILVQIHNPTRRLNFIETSIDRDTEEIFESALIKSWNPDLSTIPSSAIVTDVENNGRPDIIAGIEDRASLRVLSFNERGIPTETIWPSLKQVEKIAEITDSKGDGYLLLSKEESLLATLHWNDEKDRFDFPQPLNISQSPITFSVTLHDDQETVFLATKPEAKSSRTQIHLIKTTDDFAIGDDTRIVELPEKQNLEELVAQDLNDDGLTDLICFIEYKEPVIYMASQTGEDATWSAVEDNSLLEGLIKDIKPDHISSITMNDAFGRKNQVIQKEYVRLFSFDDTNEVSIDYQIIGPESDISYSQALDGNFLDPNRKSLLFKNDDTREFEIFEWNSDTEAVEFSRSIKTQSGIGSNGRLLASDVSGDERDEIIVLYDDKIAVYPADSAKIETSTRSTYETETEDGGYGIVYLPDETNHKGLIPVLEMKEYSVDFLGLDEDSIISDYRFKVFNRDFQYRRRNPLEENPEPRGMTWADFNGDGVNDFLLLAHDKLLIYLYEENTEEKELSSIQ